MEYNDLTLRHKEFIKFASVSAGDLARVIVQCAVDVVLGRFESIEAVVPFHEHILHS